MPFTKVWGVGAAGDWATETLILVPLLCFSVSCPSLMIKLDFKYNYVYPKLPDSPDKPLAQSKTEERRQTGKR